MKRPFKREEHVFRSEEFAEIIKDTIRFFNGTPVLSLIDIERFTGTGVYSLYYVGKNPTYRKLAERNRMEFAVPVYVGKAVPRGWRQARVHSDARDLSTTELYSRIREHSKSIASVNNLNVGDFYSRFMILEGAESDLIGTVEAALIRNYKPLWNAKIDGFGNHDPGSGRYNQAKSDWDVIHPGRSWADKCKGTPRNKSEIESDIDSFLNEKGL